MVGILKTDVLVIGSGGAGCRAALEACIAGAHVTLVTKGTFGKSGTTAFRVADTAGYNFADGVVDKDDNPDNHYKDILQAGKGMAYRELARVLAAEAVETAPYLERLGVKFERDPTSGRYIEVRGCFASKPRMHILKNHGEQIIRAMVPEIKKQAINIVEHTIVTRLLVNNDRCVGALGLNRQNEVMVFRAKGVVLACGGAGQLFRYTLTPPDITGDGYALGLRAGAQLVNMEFMQVVLGTLRPTRNQFNTFLWCARPRMVNAAGRSFLENYLPPGVTVEECMENKSKHFPFSTSDNSRFIEIAVQKEQLKEHGFHSGAFVDLTGVTDAVVAKLSQGSPLPKVWPMVKEFMRKRGFAIEREPVPIACFAHALNGGLKIDVQGATTLPGLYAAGEVAGGPHGADRLGGNMLVACQVFGARAGRTAARKAKVMRLLPLPEKEIAEEKRRLQTFYSRKGTQKISELKKRLQQAMWKEVLVVRSKEALGRALDEIFAIRADMQDIRFEDEKDLRSFFELGNLLVVGQAVARSALYRRESRGSHYREDFPKMDPDWEKRILLSFQHGELTECEEPAG